MGLAMCSVACFEKQRKTGKPCKNCQRQERIQAWILGACVISTVVGVVWIACLWLYVKCHGG